MTDSQAERALAGARPVPFWLDRPEAPRPLAPLRGQASADLAVIGGGFTGLWAALLAKEADPSRDQATRSALGAMALTGSSWSIVSWRTTVSRSGGRCPVSS